MKNKRKQIYKKVFTGLSLVLISLLMSGAYYTLNADDPAHSKEYNEKIKQAIKDGKIDLEKGEGLDEWRRIQEERIKRVVGCDNHSEECELYSPKTDMKDCSDFK